MSTPDTQQPKYQIQDLNGTIQQPSLACKTKKIKSYRELDEPFMYQQTRVKEHRRQKEDWITVPEPFTEQTLKIK